jgi:protoporphyrinogen oxidase
MKVVILGAGISGISLAYNLQKYRKIKEIIILEKEREPGGLLRSFNCKGIAYDIGPHIIFSKHKDILKKNIDILGKNVHKIRRSNKIIYKNKLIKYPFENELSKLPNQELKYCLNTFLNNPFENYEYKNMLQFFLKIFGEGITKTYLEPYNQKIWKFDPTFMDTQMVDRIPKPPKQDIINSAKGIKTEGYKHQLYFHYPKEKGIQALFDAYYQKLDKKNKIFLNQKIISIKNDKNKKIITTSKNKIECDKLISTIPLNEFCGMTNKIPNDILKKSKDLKYNSIIVCLLNIKGNIAGDNFAFMIPDKEIIFHRLSKLDFLGKKYSIKGTTSFLVEITFKQGDLISKMSNTKIFKKIFQGMEKLKFCKKIKDINFYEIKKFKYAYVIYDLNHRANVDSILNYYEKKNIFNAGRLGSWEYLNSDQVIFQSENLIKKILK